MVSHYVSFTYHLPGNKGSVSRAYQVIRSSNNPISAVNENCRYISDVHSSNPLSFVGKVSSTNSLSSERFLVLTLFHQKGFLLKTIVLVG